MYIYTMSTTTTQNSMNSFILINKILYYQQKSTKRSTPIFGYLSFDLCKILKQVLVPMFAVHISPIHITSTEMNVKFKITQSKDEDDKKLCLTCNCVTGQIKQEIFGHIFSFFFGMATAFFNHLNLP